MVTSKITRRTCKYCERIRKWDASESYDHIFSLLMRQTEFITGPAKIRASRLSSNCVTMLCRLFMQSSVVCKGKFMWKIFVPSHPLRCAHLSAPHHNYQLTFFWMKLWLSFLWDLGDSIQSKKNLSVNQIVLLLWSNILKDLVFLGTLNSRGGLKWSFTTLAFFFQNALSFYLKYSICFCF